MVEIIVVNMEHEMYNDGLYFQEESRLMENSYDKMRAQRFAIVSFATSFESFANRLIVNQLSKKVEEIPNGQDILTFLSVKNTGFPPKEIKNVYNKLRLMEKLFNLKTKELETKEFDEFKKIINLRNSIVHYSSGKFKEVYKSEIESLSSDGALLLRNLIKSYSTLLKIDIPDFYRKKEYMQLQD